MGKLHPRLEIFADDYGLSTGVTEAILREAELGRLDAVSVLEPVAAERLKKLHAQRLQIGLHWAPLGGAKNSTLYPHFRAMLGDLVFKRNHSPLEDHLDGQLRRFTQALGFLPSYVDSHLHVHQWPGVDRAFTRRLSHYGLRCVRATGQALCADPSPRARCKKQTLTVLGRRFADERVFPPVLMTLDYRNMRPEKTAAWIKNELRRHSGTLQLIVHPGMAADFELRGLDGFWRGRDKDSRLLEILSRDLRDEG